MPLNPTTLINALIAIDEPSPPTTPAEVADAWWGAFWIYESAMSLFLFPEIAKPLAEAAFKGVFVPAMSIPVPVPASFFITLEAAIRAALLAAGNTATLTPPATALLPTPTPLAPLLVAAVVPVGLVSPTKQAPRIALATTLHAWNLTNQGATPGGPVPAP